MRFINLTKRVFGRLKVLERAENDKRGHATFRCKCICGKQVEVRGTHLRNGRTNSCGCLQKTHHAHNFKDLTGQRFSKLSVIGYAETTTDMKSKWFVECDCGTVKTVYGIALQKGDTVSCSCGKREKSKGNTFNLKHGHAGGKHTRTYNTWVSMCQRCRNVAFRRYGGRKPIPVSVCKRWLGEHGFEHFLADMGERGEGTSIHRVNDALVYCKENCVWADKLRQGRERSGVVLNIEKARDIRKHHAEGVAPKKLADKFGISESAISSVVHGKRWKEQAANQRPYGSFNPSVQLAA